MFYSVNELIFARWFDDIRLCPLGSRFVRVRSRDPEIRSNSKYLNRDSEIITDPIVPEIYVDTKKYYVR